MATNTFQEISNCHFEVQGSYTNINTVIQVTQSYFQRGYRVSSESLTLSQSERMSDMLLRAEGLKQNARKLSEELRLTIRPPVEYRDFADVLDELSDETIPSIFHFCIGGRYLGKRYEQSLLVEIVYMQGLIEDFSMKRARDRDLMLEVYTEGDNLRRQKRFTLEAFIGRLWCSFWWIFYARRIVIIIRQALIASRTKIYAILFKRLSFSVDNGVHSHHIQINDFFGAQWLLPQDLCLNRQVFFSILRFKFQGGPAEAVVVSERFGVFRPGGLQAVRASDWENVIKEGEDLQLSVLLNQQTNMAIDNPRVLQCPRCKLNDRAVVGRRSSDGWVTCLRCNNSWNLTPADLGNDNWTGSGEQSHSEIEALPQDGDRFGHASNFRYYSITIVMEQPDEEMCNRFTVYEGDDHTSMYDQGTSENPSGTALQDEASSFEGPPTSVLLHGEENDTSIIIHSQQNDNQRMQLSETPASQEAPSSVTAPLHTPTSIGGTTDTLSYSIEDLFDLKGTESHTNCHSLDRSPGTASSPDLATLLEKAKERGTVLDPALLKGKEECREPPLPTPTSDPCEQPSIGSRRLSSTTSDPSTLTKQEGKHVRIELPIKTQDSDPSTSRSGKENDPNESSKSSIRAGRFALFGNIGKMLGQGETVPQEQASNNSFVDGRVIPSPRPATSVHGAMWSSSFLTPTLGFVHNLSHTIICETREDDDRSIQRDMTDSTTVSISDEELALLGAPWAKEGMLSRKQYWESTRKRAKDKSWMEVFVVIQKGELNMFTFGDHLNGASGIFGGGNWLSNADSVGTLQLVHSLANALPPPGYNWQRPHCMVLTMPNGGVYFFQAGTEELVNEWVATCNYWAARTSKEPLMGNTSGVSDLEYGWNRVVDVPTHGRPHFDVDWERDTSDSISARNGRSIRSRSGRRDGNIAIRGAGQSPLTGEIFINNWKPSLPPTVASTRDEETQMDALKKHVNSMKRDLERHNELREPMTALYQPRTANAMKAQTNWERKSEYLLTEIVKYDSYIESLQSAMMLRLKKRGEKALERVSNTIPFEDDTSMFMKGKWKDPEEAIQEEVEPSTPGPTETGLHRREIAE